MSVTAWDCSTPSWASPIENGRVLLPTRDDAGVHPAGGAHLGGKRAGQRQLVGATARRLADVEQRSQLLDQLFAGAQQARVLDRHCRLVGQDLHEAHVIVAEAARRTCQQADDAVDPVVGAHGHEKHRPRSRPGGTGIGDLRHDKWSATRQRAPDGTCRSAVGGQRQRAALSVCRCTADGDEVERQRRRQRGGRRQVAHVNVGFLAVEYPARLVADDRAEGGHDRFDRGQAGQLRTDALHGFELARPRRAGRAGTGDDVGGELAGIDAGQRYLIAREVLPTHALQHDRAATRVGHGNNELALVVALAAQDARQRVDAHAGGARRAADRGHRAQRTVGVGQQQYG